MKKKSENPNAFKLLIDEKVIHKYAQGLKKAHPSFNEKAFLKLRDKIKPLELRARVKLLAAGFQEFLPDSFPKALKVLQKATQAEKIKGFALWPATEFVQLYGVEFFEESFQAMREWTVDFTSEFAVRPFIIKDQKRALQEMFQASKDSNVHLRRWASEGSRPRLPWGERLQAFVKDPSPTLPLLEVLKFDPELYVRKSVSNHLNDISKDHPEIVIETLKKWMKEKPKNFEKEFEFILRQSLRTLVKKGNPAALKLLGVAHGDPALELKNFQLVNRKVKTGESLVFKFTLKNTSSIKKPFVLDYSIYYRKSNGSLSAKVFKLKKGFIEAGSELVWTKKHSFKPVTTRVYYPGMQQIEFILNGVAQAKVKFELLI